MTHIVSMGDDYNSASARPWTRIKLNDLPWQPWRQHALEALQFPAWPRARLWARGHGAGTAGASSLARRYRVTWGPGAAAHVATALAMPLMNPHVCFLAPPPNCARPLAHRVSGGPAADTSIASWPPASNTHARLA